MVEKNNQSTTVRLTLLEHDMARANTSLDRLQAVMEKHTEESATRMTSLREELKEDINILKADLEKKIESQNDLLTKISDKLNDLDKWRWVVIGMATVIGFILSKLSAIFGVVLK
jgi:ElaB/YqjD/DUF883 family membrane-anchored ribosome-binding protein